MAEITYTILNNSTDTTAVINYFEITTNLSQIQHHLKIPVTWNAPFNSSPYTDFTGSTTLRSTSKTYVNDLGNINAVTTELTTNTTIVLNTNAGIQLGWTVYNETYITSGQTVVNIIGSDTVVISSTPDVVPFSSGEAVSFIPPEYLLDINSTSGLSVGWVATGNGYGGETILEIRSGTRLVMSDQPSSSPSPGGTITFTSDEDNMVSIPPLSTATFVMDYDRITSSLGTYTSAVKIYAQQGAPVVKDVNNFMVVSAAPVNTPDSPYYGDGDGVDVGGPADCGTGDASASCSI